MQVQIDSVVGRFQGIAFELNEPVQYGQEVELTVLARVTESTLRSSRAGETRQIFVLKPVDVRVGEGTVVLLAGDTDSVDLGEPVAPIQATKRPLRVVLPEEATEELELEVEDEPIHGVSNYKPPEDDEVFYASRPMPPGPVIAPAPAGTRVAQIGGTRDSVLARFLDGGE